MSDQIVEKLTVLESMAREADLIENPFVRTTLLGLSLRWNDWKANALYGYLLNQVDGSFFLEDAFTLPRYQEELGGDLVLGKVLGRDDMEFRYHSEKAPMHSLWAGTSGSGKTNAAKVLIEQALEAGIGSIKVSDPKSEYKDVAVKFPGFLMLRWNDLRFNPLMPPPNVPHNEWWQTVVGHWAQCFNFWEGAQSLLIRLLWNLSRSGEVPTILDLLTALEMETPRYKQKDYIIMATVSSRLEMMLYTCQDVVMADSGMLPMLSERHYILQTTGLMSEIESWLLEFLLIWEYMYRIWNPEERRLTLHVYDECQHRLFSSEKERNVKKISASMISMLVDEARALNMGICSLSQEPSSLVNAVLNNSFLKVAFHLGSGIEVRVMKEAMGLTTEQADVLHSMETGEAIVRMAGGFMDPLPVRVREFREPERVDEFDFAEHQKRLKADLYKKAGVDGRGIEGVGRTRTQHDDKGEPRPPGEPGDDGDIGEEWDVLD